jgi:hypothetical protein
MGNPKDYGRDEPAHGGPTRGHGIRAPRPTGLMIRVGHIRDRVATAVLWW